MRATLIVYESAPRLGATLAALADVLGNRDAALVREISKKFEETVTGTLEELARRYADAQPKGELVIVIGPPAEQEPASDEQVDQALHEAMRTMTASRAAAQVAEALGLPRRRVYERAMALK